MPNIAPTRALFMASLSCFDVMKGLEYPDTLDGKRNPQTPSKSRDPKVLANH